MTHFADQRALHWINPPILIVALWGGSALATTVYDIGRWFCAW
jgi:hypothetical protein